MQLEDIKIKGCYLINRAWMETTNDHQCIARVDKIEYSLFPSGEVCISYTRFNDRGFSLGSSSCKLYRFAHAAILRVKPKKL